MSSAPLPVDTSEARLLLRELGARFGANYTPHFTILSDCETVKATALGALGERVLEKVLEFAPRIGVEVTPPRHRMAIVYFDAWRDYETRARAAGIGNAANAPGFFDATARRCIMSNYANSPAIRELRKELETARRRIERRASEGDDVREARHRALVREAQIQVSEETINRTVFRHELAHQVLAEYGIERVTPRGRTWLHEGLAMQFETDEMPNSFRRLDYLRAPQGRRSVALREVVADAGMLRSDHPDAAQAYASAWALVFYLCEQQPGALGAFLKTAPAKRAPPLSEFEQHFGVIDSDLEKAVRRFIEDYR